MSRIERSFHRSVWELHRPLDCVVSEAAHRSPPVRLRVSFPAGQLVQQALLLHYTGCARKVVGVFLRGAFGNGGAEEEAELGGGAEPEGHL